jgi:hypothetical protein
MLLLGEAATPREIVAKTSAHASATTNFAFLVITTGSVSEEAVSQQD